MTETINETPISVTPAFALRNYIWAVLKTEEPSTWDEAKYGGLVPIVPLNEEPELNEFPGPRIIYEYSLSPRGTEYYRGRGAMTFAVRDNNYRRLTRTMNIIDAALGRQDESARDVNDYLDRLAVPVVSGGQGVDFSLSFGNIYLSFAESGTPETEEGGPQVGVVNVSFTYFTEYVINTRPPA